MSERRIIVDPDLIAQDMSIDLEVGSGGQKEKIEKLYGDLSLPSYVHGYSLAIEYMYKWFESKFPKGYFVGGIYIDGKHVLDDYKQYSKNVVKGQNPRARMAPTLQQDFDREFVDMYMASPELYIRRSDYNDSFFKDYERKTFLALIPRALRMDFNFKVRVNTRSQQLDIRNRMEMYFRVGATQSDYISIDFHVPKDIMLNIADKAGFEIKNNEVVDIIEFINYLNSKSELVFLFKIRAINQKAEFFIRMNRVPIHINCTDKLQMDDGERDGKLDTNFHVEMNCVLTIPIPHFYAFYYATPLTAKIELKELECTPIYSIQHYDIPKVDENGWNQAAITSYATDKGETSMDLSTIFSGDNPLTRAIQHDLTRGISPAKFINIKVINADNLSGPGPVEVPIQMDWESFIAYFDSPQDETVYQIAVYTDREYINTLEIELRKFNESRMSKDKRRDY